MAQNSLSNIFNEGGASVASVIASSDRGSAPPRPSPELMTALLFTLYASPGTQELAGGGCTLAGDLSFLFDRRGNLRIQRPAGQGKRVQSRPLMVNVNHRAAAIGTARKASQFATIIDRAAAGSHGHEVPGGYAGSRIPPCFVHRKGVRTLPSAKCTFPTT